jgi:hypothetical protein
LFSVSTAFYSRYGGNDDGFLLSAGSVLYYPFLNHFAVEAVNRC